MDWGAERKLIGCIPAVLGECFVKRPSSALSPLLLTFGLPSSLIDPFHLLLYLLVFICYCITELLDFCVPLGLLCSKWLPSTWLSMLDRTHHKLIITPNNFINCLELMKLGFVGFWTGRYIEANNLTARQLFFSYLLTMQDDR